MRALGVRRIALLHDSQTFGVGVAEVARAEVEAGGGTVTSVGGVDPKEVNFSAVITKIVQVERPEAVLFCTNFPSAAGLMIRQLRQGGHHGAILGCDGWFDPAAIAAAGAAADRVWDREAVYVTFQTPPYDATPEIAAFATKFQARFNSRPNAYEAYGYDVANLAFAAVQKAGGTGHQQIIDALHANALPGLLNARYAFDSRGDPAHWTFYIYRVEGGAFRLSETMRG
jgi:branched-chain amino acid transport system substrate-binding protein